MLTAAALAAQTVPQSQSIPSPARKKPPQQLQPARRTRLASPNNVPEGYVLTTANQYQMMEGPWRRLRGAAQVETSELLLKADEIDYNDDTGDAEPPGTAQVVPEQQYPERTRGDHLEIQEQGYGTR